MTAILIQDCANNIYPTKKGIKLGLEDLKRIMPDIKFTICDGAIGSWRMLPNGETVFYCPPVYLEGQLSKGD